MPRAPSARRRSARRRRACSADWHSSGGGSWRAGRPGKSTEKPNLVLSSAVQVCWEKFCNYWDVEPRYVPISDEHKCLDGFELEKYVDENTIGVVAIMGVTYTGIYEPVAEIAEGARPDPGRDRSRHPDPRRRRLGRHDRAVPAAGARVGLPRRARRVDQHVGPQVRPRLPGPRLGRLAHGRRPARRSSSST